MKKIILFVSLVSMQCFLWGRSAAYNSRRYQKAADDLQLMLERCIDPNCDELFKNEIGDTLLHQAAMMGNVPMILVLKDHGVTIELENEVGETAFDLALFGGKNYAATHLINKAVYDKICADIECDRCSRYKVYQRAIEQMYRRS